MQPWDSTVQQLCPVAFMPLPLVQDTVLSAVRTALREADRRKALADYQTLVENQTDLVVRLAPNLDVLYASPSYCRMFDVSAKDVQNRPFTPRVHPDDINRVKESLATLTRPPYTCRHRERAMTKTGWRHFEWAARAQLDRSGAIAEIISVGRDITDQAVAEEEREAYRDELDRAQELAQLGTWTYDVTTGAIIWSRGMARIVGASESAPPSPDDVRPLVHPDDWRGFKDAIVRAAEEAKGFRMEIRISRPDSRHRHLLVSCEPERGPDGAVVRLLGGAQDVTELEEARSRNRELTEFPARNPYPVLRMSDRGDILYANEASQPILDHWGAAVGWYRSLSVGPAACGGIGQRQATTCGDGLRQPGLRPGLRPRPRGAFRPCVRHGHHRTARSAEARPGVEGLLPDCARECAGGRLGDGLARPGDLRQPGPGTDRGRGCRRPRRQERVDRRTRALGGRLPPVLRGSPALRRTRGVRDESSPHSAGTHR